MKKDGGHHIVVPHYCESLPFWTQMQWHPQVWVKFTMGAQICGTFYCPPTMLKLSGFADASYFFHCQLPWCWSHRVFHSVHVSIIQFPHWVFGEKRVRDYKVIYSSILSKICWSEKVFCIHNIGLVQHSYGCQNWPEAPEWCFCPELGCMSRRGQWYKLMIGK